MSDIFVVTGEKSGDEQAARLFKGLTHYTIEGVTGPHLRALQVMQFLPMEDLQVMGFFDVLIHLPRILSIMRKITHRILNTNPRIVCLIDYPGMNLRLAARLKKRGFQGKIIQIGCPTVWAWGKRRVPKMETVLDLLLTFFPFEPTYFNPGKLTAKFIGHPLANCQQPLLPLLKSGVALFPGSRKKEIERNLPIQLAVIKKISQNHPNQHFLISISQETFYPLYEKLIREARLPPSLSYKLIASSHEIIHSCEYAIAKSGTITLELALAKVPTVVMYAVSKKDIFLATKIFRIKLSHYCIVNILLQKTVFPEFIGPHCTSDNIYNASEQLHLDPLIDTLPTLLHSEVNTSLLLESLLNASIG